MLLHNAFTPQGFKRDCSISYDGVLVRKLLSCQAVLLFTHGFKGSDTNQKTVQIY